MSDPTRWFFCPRCDETLFAHPEAVRVKCPDCGTVFVVDNDAEFVDGRWRDCSALHAEDSP